jgi:hypothetical protein
MPVSLTRVTTLEKQGKSVPQLPARAIKESTYISDDNRFFVYKIDNTSWGWHSIKDDYINNINNLSHYDTSKEKVVRALEGYIAEENADLQLWKA